MTVPTISSDRLYQKLLNKDPVDLIDVRTPVEFQESHPEGARNIPLHELSTDGALQQEDGSDSQTVYFICQTGRRARRACKKMIEQGRTNVVNVEGGLSAWEHQGLPVVRGQKRVSLDRQVRIAAGILVLLSVILGWLIHPGFVGLAAFVGAGLVFAGITDT